LADNWGAASERLSSRTVTGKLEEDGMANPSDNIDDEGPRSGGNGGGNGAGSGANAGARWSARDLDNEEGDLGAGEEELLADQPRFTLADFGASIDEAVSTRPVLALAVAFVAGALFARLAL